MSEPRGPSELFAIKIGERTMIGWDRQFPAIIGNCFSVSATDDQYYRIVNFYVEDLEHLLTLGLTWPVRIKDLGKGVAVIHDERITNRAYHTHFCTSCCPEELLNPFQRLYQERQIARGEVTLSEPVEAGGFKFRITRQNVPGPKLIGD